jgi:hypothetical protein
VFLLRLIALTMCCVEWGCDDPRKPSTNSKGNVNNAGVVMSDNPPSRMVANCDTARFAQSDFEKSGFRLLRKILTQIVDAQRRQADPLLPGFQRRHADLELKLLTIQLQQWLEVYGEKLLPKTNDG